METRQLKKDKEEITKAVIGRLKNKHSSFALGKYAN